MEENKKYLKPFLKWAGGKTQLLPYIIKYLPNDFNNYFEPFVGGGSVFLNISSLVKGNIHINDINTQLINCYLTIKHNHKELIDLVNKYDKIYSTKELYYEARLRFNQLISLKEVSNEQIIEMSALFVYINKHCFNGLFRVNSDGLFNVPFNNKSNIHSINEEDINTIHKSLKKINIYNFDYQIFLKNKVRKNDFVFFDSPYDSISSNSFTAYTKDGFKKDDHISLSNIFKKLNKKGCYLMLTNHDTPLIRELYKDFYIKNISVRRNINSDPKNRKGNEVIITNYKIDN